MANWLDLWYNGFAQQEYLELSNSVQKGKYPGLQVAYPSCLWLIHGHLKIIDALCKYQLTIMEYH